MSSLIIWPITILLYLLSGAKSYKFKPILMDLPNSNQKFDIKIDLSFRLNLLRFNNLGRCLAIHFFESFGKMGRRRKTCFVCDFGDIEVFCLE